METETRFSLLSATRDLEDQKSEPQPSHKEKNKKNASKEADTVGVGNQHTQTDADEINCQNPVSERSEVGLHRIR